MSADEDEALDLKHVYATAFDAGVRLNHIIENLPDLGDVLADAKEHLANVREFLADAEMTMLELGRRRGVVVDEREALDEP